MFYAFARSSSSEKSMIGPLIVYTGAPVNDPIQMVKILPAQFESVLKLPKEKIDDLYWMTFWSLSNL